MENQSENAAVPKQPQTQKVPETQVTKSQGGIPTSYSYTASQTSHCQRQGTGLEGILVWPTTDFLILVGFVEDFSLILNESSPAKPCRRPTSAHLALTSHPHHLAFSDTPFCLSACCWESSTTCTRVRGKRTAQSYLGNYHLLLYLRIGMWMKQLFFSLSLSAETPIFCCSKLLVADNWVATTPAQNCRCITGLQTLLQNQGKMKLWEVHECFNITRTELKGNLG